MEKHSIMRGLMIVGSDLEDQMTHVLLSPETIWVVGACQKAAASWGRLLKDHFEN